MASLQSAALKELKRKSLIQDSNSVSYDNSCPILEIEEPQPYAETLESPQWMQTWTREEVESIIKHGTWVLENLPSGKRTVKSKWVLK
jgi:hypothetical protein